MRILGGGAHDAGPVFQGCPAGITERSPGSQPLSIFRIIITHMTTRDAHLQQYTDFRKGADLEANPEPLRVESLFLAVFHLIDACAAGRNVHIDKHKSVRRELDANPAIFGARTRGGGSAVQDIEARLPP